MSRLRFLRLALRMNFPPHRMRLWATHAPCDVHTCNTCNPEIGSGMILW